MLSIENMASFQAALRRDINLFVGAGFSVLAKDKSRNPMPIGTALVDELCREFSEPDLINQSLPLVSQVIKSKDRNRFNAYLKERFTVHEYDERYNLMATFSISSIFTTNIDNLFNLVFEKCRIKYLNDLILQGATFRDSSAVEYLPLHGSVLYADADFTFTPIEIASAFANNPTQFQYLVTCLKKAPTVFLGYSLQDAGSLQSLNATFTNGPQEKSRWIQLREPDAAAEAYFRALGFQIIIGDTEELLDFFRQEAGKLAVDEPQSISHVDFGTGAIPSLQQAAVRPITDFYKGHAPVWHDVLSRRIPTTAKFNELVNQIDAGRNVLLTGIPVSGKSTLLMQAAAYLDTTRTKLFEDVITVEKANSIISTAQGRGSIIVFIDNVGDSVDALDFLTAAPNIQVVAADRSVNIGFGSHRFKSGKFVQIDCTDLHSSDYSKIFDAIPLAVRSSNMQVPRVESEYNPSIFEFIEGNVVGQKISDRYREVLVHLRDTQIEIHDLFVMICYVFSCHAPVSFDVVSRFTKAGGDFKIVYSLTERLGKLLADIDTADNQFVDLDGSQDYFTPRSNLISETVIEMCRDKDFSRIYLQFHENVPRLFIPRYSNFRRYGYRSGLVNRVFKDWEDGEKFYLKAYSEDRSYFLKQQLAIFLGAKKQFELAFKYIDEALNESKNQNPNIRHTHARLLFDANIDKAVYDSSLRGNLRRSMEILEGCHEYDKRQTNHALRFAQQSIKYSSVFPGREADGYCEKAIGWLNEEVQKTPSLRHARFLLKELSR